MFRSVSSKVSRNVLTCIFLSPPGTGLIKYLRIRFIRLGVEWTEHSVPIWLDISPARRELDVRLKIRNNWCGSLVYQI